jgi:acetylornithine deacetylase/succinyl-diaminopimelate desuccinylase-like protein
MSDFPIRAVQYAHRNHASFLSDLKKLAAIPSVSTDPEHKSDMLQAAEFLSNALHSLGLSEVEIFSTPGHPIVYGKLNCERENAPIVLIYGHYDVQPPDPIDLWESPPFSPEQRGDHLYARGASDMKGQVIASLKAIESIIRTGKMPVTVKFLFEGEEEIGSPNLERFIEDHKTLLACQVVLNPDSGMIAPDVPTIVYALRGLAYFELRVFGPAHDLHSGVFGGVVYNPAQALSLLVAGMHDSQGCVTLPGFYNRVRPLDPGEQDELVQLPLGENYYLKQTGSSALWGEAGYSPAERVGARPTLDVNGLYSGFIGKGSKTVIPSWAMAKISMRLVPDQNPQEVHQQLVAYLEEHALPGIRWELTPMSGGPACITDRTSAYTQSLARALQTVWGKPPSYKREGGSIPVVASMQQLLGVDSVLTGFGLPDDNIHAPNERLHLPTWYKGIDSLIHFFYNLPENQDE